MLTTRTRATCSFDSASLITAAPKLRSVSLIGGSSGTLGLRHVQRRSGDDHLHAHCGFADLETRWTIPHHVRFHRNGTRAVLHDQPRPTDELRVRCQAALSSIDRFSLPICANQHPYLRGRSSRQEQRRFRTFESCTQCRWLCRNILLYDGAGTSSAGAPAIFGAACASW